MRNRVLRLSAKFHRTRRLLAQPGSPAAAALAATIARLLAADLPAPQDAYTMIAPPVIGYWFRRVPGCNLWVLYSFDDEQLTLRSLTDEPPIPTG